MSSELHVLFSGKVPTKAALTRAMKELGFPVTIPAGSKPLAQQSGYLPMKLRREESGVEVDVSADRSVVEEIAGKHFDPRFERCVSFRWGGDEREMVCALCTAAALAKLVDGIVRDDDSRHLSADQAIADARQSLSRVKPAEPRYGTRPADIKRYLKPLLELRSDLVVVGRHLFIRPVRHLLRGALFVHSSDKYRFEIMGYVHPLYSAGTYGYDMCPVGLPTEVWQPHFAAQLFDALKTDVFDRWGPVTTLDGFATWFINDGGAHYGVPIMCLALAGEWDRAAECAERAERELKHETDKAKIRELWEQLTTDIDAVCAKLHAREAENVKTLKLERIWDPAPFPVELSAAERTRSADLLFPTTPWIPSSGWPAAGTAEAARRCPLRKKSCSPRRRPHPAGRALARGGRATASAGRGLCAHGAPARWASAGDRVFLALGSAHAGKFPLWTGAPCAHLFHRTARHFALGVDIRILKLQRRQYYPPELDLRF